MVPWLKHWFYIKNWLFEALKLTKNVDLYKCFYFGYGIGFDLRPIFLISNFDFDKNVINSGVDNRSSIHADNKKKEILISK